MLTALYQILLGSILLSLVHASIPNHWLPLVAIGKTEKWSRRETLGVTAITGTAHTLSTIIIGIIVGLLGYQLSSSYELITKVAAPAILVALGIIYVLMDLRKNKLHKHHHHLNPDEITKSKGKNKTAIIATLAFGMFFSPCLEIEAYYFTASKLGWLGIAIVSAVYFFITVSGIMTLVFFGLKGIEKIKSHFMEHHEFMVSGIVLILLGIISFFIE